ncbi:MAG: phosphotransferase [Candidatus Nanopelagicales bacterium]
MVDHLALLTGQDVGHILAAGVAGSGGEILAWSSGTVAHRPGSLTTASFRAQVRWGDRVSDETLVASAGGDPILSPAPGVVVLGDGVDQVSLWRFPSDPVLPGLAVAADPARLRTVLAGLGVAGFSPTDGPLELRLLTYRPCRRAVIQASTPSNAVFVRVMRPKKVQALHQRHVLLHSAGVPVPRSWGWTDDGLLAIEAIPGSTLRHHLHSDGPLPDAGTLTGLLDRFPAAMLDLPLRRSWADESAHYAGVVGSTVPAEHDRAAALATAIAAGLAGLEPDRPTHGDFHDDQLLMNGARIGGLLDVDTAGPGRRADDLATLLAHLHASVLGGAPHPDRLGAVALGWQQAAEREVDAAELRLRVAGVLLTLATGPFRTQQPGWAKATTLHIEAVQRWVESAQQLRP